MAEDEFDAVPPRNPNGKARKAYSPPVIIFSELTHSSTASPTNPGPKKLHGSSSGDAMHSDSTDATS